MQPYLWISRDHITPISLSLPSLDLLLWQISILTDINATSPTLCWLNKSQHKNITLNTSNSNDRSSNPGMQNSALHIIYFRKFDKYRIDWFMTEHFNAHDKLDLWGGLGCFWCPNKI